MKLVYFLFLALLTPSARASPTNLRGGTQDDRILEDYDDLEDDLVMEDAYAFDDDLVLEDELYNSDFDYGSGTEVDDGEENQDSKKSSYTDDDSLWAGEEDECE